MIPRILLTRGMRLDPINIVLDHFSIKSTLKIGFPYANTNHTYTSHEHKRIIPEQQPIHIGNISIFSIARLSLCYKYYFTAFIKAKIKLILNAAPRTTKTALYTITRQIPFKMRGPGLKKIAYTQSSRDETHQYN